MWVCNKTIRPLQVDAKRSSRTIPTAAPTRRQSASRSALRIRMAFDGIRKPIEFRDCPEILDCLSQLLNGWRFAPTDSGEDADLRISRRAGSYRIEAPWIDGALRDRSIVGATSNLLIDIVSSFLKDNPSLLCLHCGAAIFAGRAVVFPSTNRAGKSTLIARLGAEGIRIAADDLMPITAGDNLCQALGIPPRPRIPLPATASAKFRSFVGRHAGPGDSRYQYVRLPEGQLCAHGEQVPFGAVVMLERKAGAPASFLPARRSEALAALVQQNVARDEPAADILHRLDSTLHEVPTLHLRYSDLDEAVALLAKTFSQWPPHPPSITEAHLPRVRAARRPRPGEVGVAARKGSAHAARALYERHPRVQSRIVDGEIFLTDPDGTNILQLNVFGSAVWSLLAEPTSWRGAAETIHLAFPDVAKAQIEADIAAHFDDLLAAGLIRRAGMRSRGRRHKT
jgi:hypothetical protein